MPEPAPPKGEAMARRGRGGVLVTPAPLYERLSFGTRVAHSAEAFL
jgi:hypothetical protein